MTGTSQDDPPFGPDVVVGRSRPVAESRPDRRLLPVVVASPHSGRIYPPEFLAQSQLPLERLRMTEDCFVDEICADAPALGAVLLHALFPRAFIDVNREAWELDPEMWSDPLPDHATTCTARIVAGLGTIARVVANAEEIYATRLPLAEAERRIRTCYLPYHAALRRLVDETRERFGFCILLDCHSMPSGAARGQGRSGRPADIVLGDCHGTSCDPRLIACAERLLEGRGYAVRRNAPYAGGHVTRHYGAPDEGIHALQVEINRALYLDEARLRRLPEIRRLRRDVSALVATLGGIDLAGAPPLAAE